MEVEVVDVDGDKGDDHIATNAASNKFGKENITENSSEIETMDHDDDESLKPNMGMEFDSEDAAKTLYDAYARRVGFSTHVGQFTRAKPDGPIVTWEFACSREVFKRKNVESCNAMLRIERKDPDKWIVSKFVEDHNHSIVTPSKVHYLRPRRHFAGSTKNVAETLDGTTDVYVTMDGNHVSYEPNRVRNVSPIEPNHTSRNIGPTTIPLFFKQYERALEHSIDKEIEADNDTICTTPVLKTPSPMEQQAANLYSKKVFAKFQEELVETFVYTANKIEGDGAVSKFRVAKYEHDDKAYIVALNISEMKASCSCQMFEYSGILCKHILTVFTVTNVLTLPPRYILKRWTRNAKSWIGVDERNADTQGIETLTLRFNNLCREAIKYAEEGAIALETYNAAIAVLREGGKKIAAVKKNVAKVKPPSSQGARNSNEEGNKKTSPSIPELVPSLWPWQEAMPHRFNLNDGVPVSDLNQPSMTPVSIHRDCGTGDGTVVLTCFKSMTWVIENKNSTSASKVAVINLKLHDYGKNPSGETDVQFRLTRVTLEPMLRSMAYIGQQLSTPANKVAVINLKK
ncbi:hypothetical protein EZV62_025117 [Acer yangbiense]|uniref:Protein FAR1-RELATED SEQUENCE n=1 Tax=Acer yangbiense TaxID=1000413 RepID=A0A5C7GY50_9ROSI|nr:hypothetical protein EZV62_025117 [Acer yangbiense]